jgi:hypothetical protein
MNENYLCSIFSGKEDNISLRQKNLHVLTELRNMKTSKFYLQPLESEFSLDILKSRKNSLISIHVQTGSINIIPKNLTGSSIISIPDPMKTVTNSSIQTLKIQNFQENFIVNSLTENSFNINVDEYLQHSNDGKISSFESNMLKCGCNCNLFGNRENFEIRNDENENKSLFDDLLLGKKRKTGVKSKFSNYFNVSPKRRDSEKCMSEKNERSICSFKTKCCNQASDSNCSPEDTPKHDVCKKRKSINKNKSNNIQNKKHNFQCDHGQCDTKFKTGKLKLSHHNKLEPECKSDRNILIKLISTYSEKLQKLLKRKTSFSIIDHNRNQLEDLFFYFKEMQNEIYDPVFFQLNIGDFFENLSTRLSQRN